MDAVLDAGVLPMRRRFVGRGSFAVLLIQNKMVFNRIEGR